MMDLRLVESINRPRPPSTRRTARGAIRAAAGSGRRRPPARSHVHRTVRFHLTNHVQEGIDLRAFLRLMGNRVARSAFSNFAVSSSEAVERTAALLNKYPDRFLFGTDMVAPAGETPYYAVFDMWKPVFDRLSTDARDRILEGNYARIFEAGRKNVRAWERTQLAQRQNGAASGSATRRSK